MTFDNHGDADEAQITGAMAATVDPSPSRRTQLQGSFTANTMRLLRTSGLDKIGEVNKNVYFIPILLDGATGYINEKVTNLADINISYGPVGSNNVILWRERVFSSHPRPGILYSSQLESTASIFQDGPVNIPNNYMAVFNVSDTGADFQIGICPDGYMRTGSPVGTVVDLTPECTFTFVGLFPFTSPLNGPHGTGRGRSVYQ